jgi:hypothetical protein
MGLGPNYDERYVSFETERQQLIETIAALEPLSLSHYVIRLRTTGATECAWNLRL